MNYSIRLSALVSLLLFLNPGARAQAPRSANTSPSSSASTRVLSSRSIRSIISGLRRFHDESELQIDVPANVASDLTELKHRLRDLIIKDVGRPYANNASSDQLQQEVIGLLEREDVPVGDNGGFGVIRSIEFRRPAEYSDWLIATTSLAIPYGEDRSLYVFQLKGTSWKHVLTQESNDYKQISGAQGWLTYRVATIGPNKLPYLVTANVTPSAASVWQALRLKVLRPGAEPDHPDVLAARTLSYCLDDDYYFSFSDGGFGLMFLAEPAGPDLAGYRGVHYLEYVVSPTHASAVRELTVDPYVVVRKWRRQDWNQAQRFVTMKSSTELRNWHRRLEQQHWECGLSGLSLSHRSLAGKEQLLAIANCTSGDEKRNAFAVIAIGGKSGWRIESISDTKPALPEQEGEQTFFAGIEGLTNPVAVTKIKAKWPADVPGPKNVSLRMSVVVNDKGDVTDVSVLDWPEAKIVVPAIEAVRKWKYDPGRMAGKPVAVQTEVAVTFEN